MTPNILLLSIQPQYAEKIFKGEKSVELRRTRPRHLRSGDLILVYIPSPERLLFGVVEVDKVVEDAPRKLWSIVKNKAGISYRDFKDYYKGTSTGFAIFISQPISFDSPIGLEKLRQKWVGFRPPQCYRYLKEKELDIIQSLIKQDVISPIDEPKEKQLSFQYLVTL